jgi:hypothetical protein
MESIKNLFTKNPTMSPALSEGAEKAVTQMENETQAVS